MTASTDVFEVVTVTLNPAIDRTLTVPDFAAGAVNRVTALRSRAGGKGVNVAAALAGAGVRVAATGFLGRRNEQKFVRFFAEHGIADEFVRLEGATRFGLKIVCPERRETTDLNFPGLAATPAALAALTAKLASLTPKWVVLAGSVPPGVDPTIYRDLTLQLKARGIRVALDTSGEPLRLALPAAPHLLKPNRHELEALLGAPVTDLPAAARELVARGVGLVAVSMGADGAWFVTAEETHFAQPPAIPIHSTVGAGDAMVAGLVAARLRGLSLRETAALATAFAVDALSQQTARKE